MAWYLSREFGDTATVNYNDMAQAPAREKYPHIVDQLRKGALILPTVYLDEQVVSLGSVDYFALSKAIHQARDNDETGNRDTEMP